MKLVSCSIKELLVFYDCRELLFHSKNREDFQTLIAGYLGFKQILFCHAKRNKISPIELLL